jgi:pentatricopeptide repeat protein
MYLVLFRSTFFGGYNCSKFESLDEALELVKEMREKGNQDVVLSQEIPLKVYVTVTVLGGYRD